MNRKNAYFLVIAIATLGGCVARQGTAQTNGAQSEPVQNDVGARTGGAAPSKEPVPRQNDVGARTGGAAPNQESAPGMER